MSLAISWVQFDERESREASQFLADLSQGTVDELGFGRIRAHFADLFFPETTTVMTRPRYLIFLPALIEAASHAKDPQKELAHLERKICRTMIENFPSAPGIVGRRGPDDLGRLPSDIYWPAMRKLQLVRWSGTLASFFQALRKHQEDETDDEGQRDAGGLSRLFDTEALKLGRKVLFEKGGRGPFKVMGLDMSANPDEQRFLVRRYQDGDRAGSLMSYFIDQPQKITDQIWQVELPPAHPLNLPLRDAIGFSALAMGGDLVYRHLLAVHAKADQVAAECLAALGKWRKTSGCNTHLIDWDPESAMLRLTTDSPGILRKNSAINDYAFIGGLHSIFKEHDDPTSLIAKAGPVIERREKLMKPGRAKLAQSGFTLDENAQPPDHSWRIWTGYRWNVAKRFLADLLAENVDV